MRRPLTAAEVVKVGQVTSLKRHKETVVAAHGGPELLGEPGETLLGTGGEGKGGAPDALRCLHFKSGPCSGWFGPGKCTLTTSCELEGKTRGS